MDNIEKQTEEHIKAIHKAGVEIEISCKAAKKNIEELLNVFEFINEKLNNKSLNK